MVSAVVTWSRDHAAVVAWSPDHATSPDRRSPGTREAVKGFKDGVKGEEDKPAASGAPTQVTDKGTIDVEAKEKNKV